MFLQPKKYVIETSLPKKEVFNLLFENTAENKFTFVKSKKEFKGTVYKDSFEIEKIISGRNSFNPKITGTFEPLSNGNTEINFNLQFNSFVKFFILIWIGFVSLFFILSLINNILMGMGFSLVLIFFAITLVYLGIKMSVPNIIHTFEKLFQSKVHEIKEK